MKARSVKTAEGARIPLTATQVAILALVADWKPGFRFGASWVTENLNLNSPGSVALSLNKLVSRGVLDSVRPTPSQPKLYSVTPRGRSVIAQLKRVEAF